MKDAARVVGLVVAIILTGCTQRAPLDPVLPSTEVSEFIEHRVSYSGETLASIAQWYTGSSKRWNVIQNANPDLKPNRLKIGNLVRIPRALVVRTDTMPKPRERVVNKAAPVPVDSHIGDRPLESPEFIAPSPAGEATPQPTESVSASEESKDPEIDLSAVPETPIQDEDSSTAVSEGSGGSFLSALGKALAPAKK